jgi:hypothetical protein
MKKLLILIITIVVFLCIGCIMPTSNVAVSSGDAVKSIKKIAIWQFQDGGSVSNSGSIATRALESALMLKGFKIASLSRVRNVIGVEFGDKEEVALDAGMLTSAVLSRLREQTGADAIMIGAVTDAWCNAAYIPPCWIECSFQIVNTYNGDIIVSANVSDDGYSLQKAAQQMANKAIKKIK